MKKSTFIATNPSLNGGRDCRSLPVVRCSLARSSDFFPPVIVCPAQLLSVLNATVPHSTPRQTVQRQLTTFNVSLRATPVRIIQHQFISSNTSSYYPTPVHIVQHQFISSYTSSYHPTPVHQQVQGNSRALKTSSLCSQPVSYNVPSLH